ncbi:MAG: EF-hand domain-containing protein [Melioribacteraceae bacterium]
MKILKVISTMSFCISLLIFNTNSNCQDMKKLAKKAYQDLLKELDKNKDGKISKSEFMKAWKDKNVGEKNFSQFNQNKDSFITEEEYINTALKFQRKQN